MAIESGREYNPETASHLRSKVFTFRACGVTFSYTLEIPAYILSRLNTSVLDQMQDYMTTYAHKVVTEALRVGYFHTEAGQSRMKTDVGLHLRNYLWERFSIIQEGAGNDCWQVAPSLQRVHTA